MVFDPSEIPKYLSRFLLEGTIYFVIKINSNLTLYLLILLDSLKLLILDPDLLDNP